MPIYAFINLATLRRFLMKQLIIMLTVLMSFSGAFASSIGELGRDGRRIDRRDDRRHDRRDDRRRPTYVREVLTCSSENYRPATCFTSLRRIHDVVLLRQISRSSCRPGYSYEVRGNAILVRNGCRAMFQVTGTR